MVCIAAFIVLCLVSVFVGFLSIFRRDIGKKYFKVFKKSWACVGKRVTLQKCETGFGDDVKNMILGKLVLKNPKLLKPASVAIEVVSVLIVFVSIWSLVEASKAGLALWTLGTCNVQHPSACTLGATACSIDEAEEDKGIIGAIGGWFSDWGEIFEAVPDKFRSWDVDNFDFHYLVVGSANSDAETAIDVFDPGCLICSQSFRAQYESGFFKEHPVRLVPFPIQDSKGVFKYDNSNLIVSYIYATAQTVIPEDYKARDEVINTPALEIIYRIFMEEDNGTPMQDVFNYSYDNESAEQKLQDWLKELGFDEPKIANIAERAKGDEVKQIIAHNNTIVIDDIHAKGIPTTIFNNKKHTGKFEG